MMHVQKNTYYCIQPDRDIINDDGRIDPKIALKRLTCNSYRFCNVKLYYKHSVHTDYVILYYIAVNALRRLHSGCCMATAVPLF